MKASFVEFVQIWDDLKGYGDIPALHVEYCKWLEQTQDTHPHRILMGYRHSAKSDMACLYVCWRLYCDPEWTCVVISATEKLAKRNSRFIREILQVHPLTQHLVPEKARGDSATQWQTFQFSVNRKNPSNHASVQIAAIKGQMTGLHGDQIICDDVETSENCKTEEAREVIRNAVLEMTSLADNMLFVGTPHHEESIYKMLEEENDFLVLRKPVEDAEGNPAWPERHPKEWIEEKRRINTLGRFLSQYMLIPKKAYETLLDEEQITHYSGELYVDELDILTRAYRMGKPRYRINGDEVMDIKAYWDVATGQRHRDNSVVAVVLKGKSGAVYLHDLAVLPPVDRKNGTGFDAQCAVVLKVCARNFVNAVYVEKNFSYTLADELRKKALHEGYKVHIRESTRTSSQNKNELIADTLEPLMKTARLYIRDKVWRETPFRNELLEFPGGAHDDCLDATVGAIRECAVVLTDTSKGKPLVDNPFKRNMGPVAVNAPKRFGA